MPNSEELPKVQSENLADQKIEQKDIPEGFLVMREEDVELYKTWVKKKIKVWHELNPDLVILADSSAVPIGFALKEAYIKTFGKDSFPKFYRFNPGSSLRIPMDWRIGGAPLELPVEELENRAKEFGSKGAKDSALIMQSELKKFIGRGKRIITYDETSRIPGRDEGEDKIVQVMANGKSLREDITLDFSKSSEWGQANRGFYALARTVFGESDVWIDSGEPNRPSEYPHAQWMDLKKQSYFHHIRGRYENPVSKSIKGSGPTKDPQKKERAMEFIHDLKFIGDLVAEEILKEQQEKK